MTDYSKLVAFLIPVGLILAGGCTATPPIPSSPASGATATVTAVPIVEQTQAPSVTPQASAARNGQQSQLAATETPTSLTPTPITRSSKRFANAASNLSLFHFYYVYSIGDLFDMALGLPWRMHAASLFCSNARLVETS